MVSRTHFESFIEFHGFRDIVYFMYGRKTIKINQRAMPIVIWSKQSFHSADTTFLDIEEELSRFLFCNITVGKWLLFY